MKRTAAAGARETTADNIDQILDTALASFMDFGLRRSTMEDVARRAGISRATLYRHFSDRNALVMAVVLRECQRAVAQVASDIKSLPIDKQGPEGLFLTIRNAACHPLILRLKALEPESILPLLTTEAGITMEWGRAYVSQMVRAFQQHGFMVNLDADDTAELLFRLLHSFVLAPGSRVRVEEDASLRRYVEQFMWPLLNNARG